uniref:BH4_AAA_HYDROXYL_2 domain-containing protein n=1 Tax=Parastrongyloides trichosuri TaxID=131310 RepID=A0A0N4ZBI3_PARTI
MASGMKFHYYKQKSIATTPDPIEISAEERLNSFKMRFRRSGSIGMPFVSEGSIKSAKKEMSLDECHEEGLQVLTLIIKSKRSSDTLSYMMSSIPKNVRIKHIETRDPRSGDSSEIEVFLELEWEDDTTTFQIISELKSHELDVEEVSSTVNPKGAFEIEDPGSVDALSGSQWFPKSIYDLDICSKRVIMYGAGLDADHPGFKDKEYRQRRMMFAEIALNYKQGEPIPRIAYTETEKKTWGIIYRKLRELHKKHACKEFLDNFELLERHCGYSESNIPQLEDINTFLKSKTGFRVRPVAGYLSARDFLAGLAFRVFNCTQYVRHHADPFYTPEPDTVHELMGHMALFADPNFAQFSQEIGLASLGASEKDLTNLATLYFFSIEFGMCGCYSSDPEDGDNFVENGENNNFKTNDLKIYGAGLLSSAGELVHAVSDKANILRFDPDRVVKQECMITCFQTAYFYTKNFEEAQQKLRMFTNNMNRPFVVRYNAYTESVEVLNNHRSLTLAINQLRSDINLLASALHFIL